MDNDWCRLASFDSVSTSIPAMALVTSGFYYDRRTKIIRCSGCDYILGEPFIVERQLHSVECQWHLQVDAPSVENQPARVDTNHLIAVSGNQSLPDSNPPLESINPHRACSLRYFINFNKRREASITQEQHLESTRVVNYDRGHIRFDLDRQCLKSRDANIRWNSFLPLWQHKRLEPLILSELQHLCFMFSRVGFFLLRDHNSSQFKLELSCSFCKHIMLLNLSFDNSAEEILADLLHRHRLAMMSCPGSLNLQGKILL